MYKNIESYGSSNSSEGRWYVKLSSQEFYYFMRKTEMLHFLDNFNGLNAESLAV